MKATDLRKLIDASGKRGIVKYKGKDERTLFDESISQKKVQMISNFIGDQTNYVSMILSVR